MDFQYTIATEYHDKSHKPNFRMWKQQNTSSGPFYNTKFLSATKFNKMTFQIFFF